MTDQLGQYSVGKTLGKGFSSEIKLGINSQTGEKVALKIMRTKGKNGQDLS